VPPACQRNSRVAHYAQRNCKRLVCLAKISNAIWNKATTCDHGAVGVHELLSVRCSRYSVRSCFVRLATKVRWVFVGSFWASKKVQ
jgi:hypothetical protein